MIDRLIGQYQQNRRHIDQLAALVNGGDLANVVHYFIEGNAGDEQLHRTLYVERLFATEGAIHALNSAFWSKALALTDIYSYMPQDRKSQWNEQLRNPAGKAMHHSAYERDRATDEGRPLNEWQIEPLPEFTEATVRATIDGLLPARAQFLSERVDGIFRALSGAHVTNEPQGFGKRMIIARVLSEYGTTNHDRIGYLHDLRCVIAKFMGRGEPQHCGTTDTLVKAAKERRGQWVIADGGALRIRVYNVGTAHLEVHPDMAWRLNAILAQLYPLAIPAQFRQRPRRKSKAFELLGRPLPFAVMEEISRLEPAKRKVGDDWRGRYEQIPMTRRLRYDLTDKYLQAEVESVLESIGGVKTEHYFTFDYEPAEVLFEIATSGCIPDHISHQFYPTREFVGAAAVALAAIGDTDRILEPQAGNGDLAALLPRDRTLCVEISALRCSVLTARGFETIRADFVTWAASTAELFDRVVMNPPYSGGRWQSHTEMAASLVRPGGRLVAILPASARHRFELTGFVCEWSQVYANEFAGTRVSVAILTATRAA